MTSWEDIRAHLAKRGVVLDPATPNEVRLPIALRSGRARQVVATVRRVDGLQWLELVTDIGATADFDASELLVKSFSTVPGGLCRRGERCWLRHAQLLTHTTSVAFEFYVRKIAEEGESIAEEVASRRLG